MLSPQFSLFGPRDHADDLARACLNLAWEFLQRRRQLSDAGAARMWGELEVAAATLEHVTDTRLALPAVAEVRARYRARCADEHPTPTAHFRDARPPWLRRGLTVGSET